MDPANLQIWSTFYVLNQIIFGKCNPLKEPPLAAWQKEAAMIKKLFTAYWMRHCTAP
jgi:hypothetical protein